MTASFDGLGFKFLYPQGWEIQKDEDTRWPRTVSVHSPTGAFVSLTLYPKSTVPEDVLDETLAAMRAEYEEMELQSVPSTVPGREGVKAFEAHFYCLDLVVMAQVCLHNTEDFALMALYQGESRDFANLLPVFDAITMSVLSNLSNS